MTSLRPPREFPWVRTWVSHSLIQHCHHYTTVLILPLQGRVNITPLFHFILTTNLWYILGWESGPSPSSPRRLHDLVKFESGSPQTECGCSPALPHLQYIDICSLFCETILCLEIPTLISPLLDNFWFPFVIVASFTGGVLVAGGECNISVRIL